MSHLEKPKEELLQGEGLQELTELKIKDNKYIKEKKGNEKTINDAKRTFSSTSVRRIILILICSIFFSDFIIGTILTMLQIKSLWFAEIIDSIVLVIVLFPVIYIYLRLPLVNNINEHKKEAEALQKAVSLMDATFESVYNGLLVVSPQGAVIKSNAKFAEMWRIPDDILASGDDKKLLDNVLGQLVDPDEFIAKVSELYKKPEAESLDLVYFKDGRIFERISKPMYIGEEPKGRVWSFLDITERKLAEETLRERVKELNCLYGIANLIEKEDSLEKILQGTADLMPNYWFHSEIASVRIIFQGRQYQTGNFRETEWRQSAELKVDGQPVGIINVCYLEERSIRDEGQFLKEERSLINAIAERLGRVAEHKQVEEALQKSEEKYRTLIENMGEGVCIVNDEESFVFANPAAEKIFGVNKGELTGLCLSDFLPGEEIEIIKNESQKRRQGISSAFEHEIVLKDGSKKEILITATPQLDDNKFTGTFAILRDFTERRRAEAEIKLKNDELLKVNIEKDKFFSIIAHDLRGPLGNFLGLTEIMAERLPDMTPDKMQEIAVSMRNSAENLYRLLDNLLEWSRMQRGLIIFYPELFLLKPKISKNKVLAMEATNKEIEISCDIPEDLMVFADKNMLGGIIRNLSSNAVKFTPKGGKITMAAKSIPGDTVEISIRDTGIGMDKEMIDNLFRLDINTSRKGTEDEPSTGLGLIICKDFIEKHGGKLRVDSKEGKGSVFSFRIPGDRQEQEKK